MHSLITIQCLALLADRDASGPDLTRYLIVCSSILLLTGLGAYLAKRYLAGALKQRAAKRTLRIVDVLPMGGRRQVAVVRIYDRTFVLGVGEKEVSLITELDPVIGETPEKPTEALPNDERDFQKLLRSARARLERSVLEPQAPAPNKVQAPAQPIVRERVR